MLQDLSRARALIFDFRGYSTTGLTAVSHLIDRPVEQLVWQIPELPDGGHARYTPVHRWQYPLAPRLNVPVVALIDGQSISTVETTLAMIRDYHLGVLVGETTSGTSGLISTFTVPGGYTIRFTAVGLVDAAGQTLQGRGIAPDVVVHPTLDGVRAHRDEILEAGLAEALRLISP
jgi:C-terminal processing protease CtpA/Prc